MPLDSALLLLQLLVILGASRAVGMLFRRVGQPQVIAEIITGMALGPTLFGRVAPEAFAALFPASSLPGLDALSQVGLVLFMFLVGLELDVEALRRLGRAAAGVTIGTTVLPMIAGASLGLSLFSTYGQPGVSRWVFSFFVAICFSVTAFPVLARILAERGMLKTKIGVVSLSAAAAHDLGGFVLVGVATAAAGAHSPAQLLRAVAVTVGFVAGMLFVLRPVLVRVERRFGTLRDLSQTGFALLVIAVIASAFVAERVGIHALFGAFLAGVTMPRVHRTSEAIRGRLEDIATLLLLPVFFASTGIRTDLVDALSVHAGLTLGIIGLSTGAMVIGAVVPARFTGFSWREGFTLGALANTRGLMELVILKIGRDLGLLPPPLFAMLVVMAVTNTLMTTPLVALLYPRRRVMADMLEVSGSAAEWRLVVCVSHPDSAEGLGRLAVALGQGDTRGWALHLQPMGDQPGLFPAAGEESDPPENRVATIASGSGLRFTPVTLATANTSASIREFVSLQHAHAVVLGLHRPLWGGAQLGGPVALVARDPNSDVIVFHDHGLSAVKRVVLGLGGDNDAAARRVAERLARRPGVELVVLDATRDGRRIDALKAASVGADLVVVGVGSAWDLPLQRFEVREPRLLAELQTSLLAVSGPTE